VIRALSLPRLKKKKVSFEVSSGIQKGGKKERRTKSSIPYKYPLNRAGHGKLVSRKKGKDEILLMHEWKYIEFSLKQLIIGKER